MPYYRHHPAIFKESHKMSNGSIKHSIWQSIFLLQKKLYKIAAMVYQGNFVKQFPKHLAMDEGLQKN